MGRSVALLGGFVLGSVVTLVVSNAIRKKKRKTLRFDDDPHRSRAVGLSSRSLSASALVAATPDQQVNFLTDMMNRLWKHINVAGSATIRETIEPMLADMQPSLRVTKVDLGRIPIRLDNIVVHTVKGEGEEERLQFDLDIIWDSEMIIKMHADYLGDFGVEAIKLKGRMAFLLKPLSDELPCVSAIQYAFIDRPELDLDFTGLANIADIGGIDQSVREVMHSTLSSMLVLPNRMLYKMDLGCDFRQMYRPPLGVARITAIGGRGFQVEKRALRGGDIPDVYLNLSLGDRACKTSTIKDNLSPIWNEAFDFIICDHDQIVRLHAWDEDKGPLDADDDLGTAQVTVADLMLAGKTIELELQQDDIPTGAYVTIHCEIFNLTTDTTVVESPSLIEQKPIREGLCGLLTIIVTQAFDVPVKKNEANSFVKVNCGEMEFVTGAVVDTPGYDCLNPTYDCVFYVQLTPELVKKGTSKCPAVVFSLINGERELGVLTVDGASVLAEPNKMISETRRVGSGGASLAYLVALSGIEQPPDGVSDVVSPSAEVSMTRALPDSAAPGMGTVLVTVLSGHGFSALKKKKFRKADIPDVYCKVKFGSNPTVWRTKTVKDSVTPVWKEQKAYILSNHNQVLSIVALDANRKGTDDELGSARVTVGMLLLSGAPIDIELEKNGICTGAFIKVKVEMST